MLLSVTSKLAWQMGGGGMEWKGDTAEQLEGYTRATWTNHNPLRGGYTARDLIRKRTQYCSPYSLSVWKLRIHFKVLRTISR